MAMTVPDGARAVFLDKDGTLVRDVPYNADPDRIELLPRSICLPIVDLAGALSLGNHQP